ncbi:MAG: membrane protein required for colicin V production [Hyphomicrobiaceae bacterium]|jgi:membrane protein required for colicin V production
MGRSCAPLWPLARDTVLDAIDLTLAVLLAYFAWRGWRRGLLSTLASLVAPVAGFVGAARYAPEVGLLLADYITAPPSFLGILAYPLTFLAAAAVVRLGAAGLGMALGLGDSPLSKIAGALAGSASAGLLIGAAVLILGSFVPEPGTEPDDGGLLTKRAHGTLVRISDRIDRTWLAPRLASITEQAIAQVFDESDGGGLPKALTPKSDGDGESAAAAPQALGAARFLPNQDEDAQPDAASE